MEYDWATVTAAELLADWDGGSPDEWMAVRCAADAAGRVDLVQFAADQVCAAYEAMDAE